MDDELKQMEIDFYGIDPNEDELLQLRYPESVSYRGKVVEPDLSCYAMTASAYAKSNLGRAGAELAEQVLRRCEKYCSSQQPNAILKTAIVKAWLQAGDFDRADEWIKDMEKTFAESRDEIDAPDTITYTQYLEGLANARNLPVEEIVRRCRRLLEKMQHLAGSGENPFARPNTFTYSAAMKCLARRQANLKKGELVVMEEVEELLRELQAKYNESGDEELKPNNYCYVAVANVGSRCYGGMQAARRTERLLRELEKQYKATGDPDFYPLDGMYTACFTAYAKVEPEHVSEASERVKDLLHELENGDRKYPPTVHAYTAAINGLTMDDNPGNLKEAEAILKRLPGPDSIAYQCGKLSHCVN